MHGKTNGFATYAYIRHFFLVTAALSEHESVRNELMSRMAKNIHNTSVEAWKQFQKSETMKQVLLMLHDLHKFLRQSQPDT